MTLDDLLRRLANACEEAGSQAEWARRHKMTRSFVSDVLNKRREPSKVMLEALKVRKIVVYEDVP